MDLCGIHDGHASEGEFTSGILDHVQTEKRKEQSCVMAHKAVNLNNKTFSFFFHVVGVCFYFFTYSLN